MKKAHLAVTLPRPLGVQMYVSASLKPSGHREQPPQNINIQRTELEGAIFPKIKLPQAFCGPSLWFCRGSPPLIRHPSFSSQVSSRHS